ncbi:AUGMIN subunit 4-like [Asparagus officinalis]|uniref:AUGMIN subunit 4-like n=1 Tax=Asparagus officinalis TaxID=4686 RepID=UPI00098E05F1|nr:AUGMIN subunit 4-like [Asparagus officinalis]
MLFLCLKIRRLKCFRFQVYDSLEHRLVVAEAAQRLRLHLSKDGEIHEEEIKKCSLMSRSSLDSTTTSITPCFSSNSTSYNNSYASNSSIMLNASVLSNNSEMVDPGVGGVPNCFLGVTLGFLRQVQQERSAVTVDMMEYQRSLVQEIESRLEAKCETLAHIFAIDENDSVCCVAISSARLPERVKFIIEEVEREEAVLLEDLYSMDRKFVEHYNVLEQILGVLIKFVKDLKLQHQHQYNELKKTWLCKSYQTKNAKLRYITVKNDCHQIHLNDFNKLFYHSGFLSKNPHISFQPNVVYRGGKGHSFHSLLEFLIPQTGTVPVY